MRFLIGFVSSFALFAQTSQDARALLMRAGDSVLMAVTVRLEGIESAEFTLRARRQAESHSFVTERSTGGWMRREQGLGLGLDEAAVNFDILHPEQYGEIAYPVPTRYVAPPAPACQDAGATTVKAIVGKDGAPRSVEGAGAPGKAVEGWQFAAATALGKAVEARHGGVPVLALR